ncbi:MAG TPA: acyl-CoA carboxylase subunit beta [Bacteroidota bacterium]|nr:acyl-CoA carboxylase subunit beta [Bacteroidota bacterium]
MALIGSELQRTAAHTKNEEQMRVLLDLLSTRTLAVREGGGKASLDALARGGKLSARERVARLVDPGTPFLEVGLFAAWEMYEEFGGAPSAGTVAGVGTVEGRDAVIVANDATVKAGAWFPMTCKKNLRAQEIAIENRLPIIYLVDSAGVFLPLQSEIFPDREHFGRIFRNNAVMSALGIVQIAAIMGPCVAGGAYLPIMSDEAMIVEGTGSVFLAGSHLVKAAIGEEIDNERLGGALVHSEISGVTDHRMPGDDACLAKIRSILARTGSRPRAGFDRGAPAPPRFDPAELHALIPADRSKPYDTHEVLARIIDGGDLDEYKAGFGKTIVTGYARIDGWAVGIVANQRAVVKTARGEMQVGGVIYSDSADKAARFILNCNQKLIPLVFFQDVTGFMVGSRAEQGGIIKDGAKMVNAVANSVVPKFTIIAGNSYGAGNYAMCGKAYDPRLIYAWPSAQIAVMGGKQASETLLAIKTRQVEKGGQHISEEAARQLLADIRLRYEKEADPYFAAARLWVDGIIDPVHTRGVISAGIGMAAHNAEIPKFSTGVIQT